MGDPRQHLECSVFAFERCSSRDLRAAKRCRRNTSYSTRPNHPDLAWLRDPAAGCLPLRLKRTYHGLAQNDGGPVRGPFFVHLPWEIRCGPSLVGRI